MRVALVTTAIGTPSTLATRPDDSEVDTGLPLRLSAAQRISRTPVNHNSHRGEGFRMQRRANTVAEAKFRLRPSIPRTSGRRTQGTVPHGVARHRPREVS